MKMILNKELRLYYNLLLIFLIVFLFAGWSQISDKKIGTYKWEKINNYFILDIIEYKGELIFATKQGIFNLKEKLAPQPAYCLATDNEILVAGTNDGLLLFDSAWQKIKLFQNGLPVQVRIIKNYNKLFFLGYTQGSYGVATWHPVKGIIYEDDFHAYIRSIEVHNSTVYAGDEDGNIWLSNNMGKSFDSTIYLNNQHLAVRSIKWINGDMFIAAGWIYKNYEQTEHYITPMDFYNEFVLSGDQGVFIIDYKTLQLIPFNDGLDDHRVSKLILHNNNLYVGTVTGLYKMPYNQIVNR